MRNALLLVLAASVTLIMQRYVGGETIYAPRLIAEREAMHRYLLANQLPPGRTWRSYGLAGASARTSTVYLAEGIHRVSGLAVSTSYFLIDSVALCASVLALFGLLRLFTAPALALSGVLFYLAILPLTYAFHFFHPWDRLSALCWIGALWCLRRERLGTLAVLLVAGVLIKYDMVPLPGLYFLAYARRDNLRAVSLTTTGLLLLSFGTYLALVLHFGSGIGERESLWVQIGQNLREAVTQPFFYAPWLAFAIPLLLCAIGWRESDRFARTAVGFAGLLAIVLFCLTNFQEVRAEIPVLLLLFPAALTGLRRVLPGEPAPQTFP